MRKRNPKIDAAWLDYQSGLSLEQIAQKLGITRQSVFCGFKRRGYQLRQQTLRPVLMLYGKKFTLRKNGDYYRSTTGDRCTAQKFVWERANGRKVPAGWCVIHIDCNVSHNTPDNLECVPRQESGKYSRRNNQHTRGKERLMVNKFCLNCGKRIKKRSPSYTNSRMFCSRGCHYDFIRGFPRVMTVDEIHQYKNQVNAEKLIFAKGQSRWTSPCHGEGYTAIAAPMAKDIVKNQREEA